MQIATGCPKKMSLLLGFEFLTLGGVFLGVKKNSKNFGNNKNIGLFSKSLSKITFFLLVKKILWTVFRQGRTLLDQGGPNFDKKNFWCFST